jgi:hypothetical protein
MAEIDDLETKVNGLNGADSDEAFKETYARIKAEFLIVANADEAGRMTRILETFIGSLSGRMNLADVKRSAETLRANLSDMSASDILGKADERRNYLRELRLLLNIEINKNNADKSALEQIRDIVNHSAGTIKGVGELIGGLRATGAGAVSSIRNLIGRINGVCRIFDPEAM